MFRLLRFIVLRIVGVLMLPMLALLCIALRALRSRRLVWCPVPLINNKYLSNAMREAGWESDTFMSEYYATINTRRDFDRYIDDLMPGGAASFWIWRLLRSYVVFAVAVARYGVFHIPFSGGFLGSTPIWRFEPGLLALANRKVILLPYGGDFYRYSTIIDPSLRHALLLSYPDAARNEKFIDERVALWLRTANIVVGSFMFDGIGRWDVIPASYLVIDTSEWLPRKKYSDADGRNGVVKVVHTPNHRGFKGTEFLVAAVESLREEGLKIELLLMEKVPNEKVREVLRNEADIIAEQFICTGYAMSAIEGMASGLPVMSNLDNEVYTRVLRRYSYLDLCPILSTTPETLKNNLRVLITSPKLRRQLGLAGRDYVEVFHSYSAAQYMFGAIYKRILDGEPVDLLNLFHPLKSLYGRSKNTVALPLRENRLPHSGSF